MLGWIALCPAVLGWQRCEEPGGSGSLRFAGVGAVISPGEAVQRLTPDSRAGIWNLGWTDLDSNRAERPMAEDKRGGPLLAVNEGAV